MCIVSKLISYWYANCLCLQTTRICVVYYDRNDADVTVVDSSCMMSCAAAHTQGAGEPATCDGRPRGRLGRKKGRRMISKETTQD
jgi:hypothetical protein